MKFGRLGMIMLLLLVILGIILGFVLVLKAAPGVSILDKPLHELRDGWMVDSAQGWVPIGVGDRPAAGDQQPILYRVTLPTDYIDPQSLIFRNPFQNVTLSIDGQSIFVYGYEDTQKLRIPTGGYHLVPIPPGSQGKELMVRFVSMYQGKPGSLPLITIGQGFTLFARVILNSLFQLMFGIMILMLGFLLSIVGLYLAWKKVPTMGLVFLGIFVQMSGMMILLSTDIPQLVLGHQQAFMAGKVSLLVLCVLPFLEFIKRFFKPAKLGLFNLCAILLRLNFLVVLGFLLATGEIPWFSFMPIHIILLFAIVLILHTLTTSRKEDESSLRQVLLAGFLVLTAGVIIDMLRFYLFVEVDNTRFFQIGLFIFTIITGLEAVNRVVDTYRQSIRAQLLEHLAYTDILTNLPNRTAFERDMEKLAQNPDQCRHCMVVMLDLDHLKDINDTFGHQAGDSVLREVVERAHGVLRPYDVLGRFGGEEFLLVIPGADGEEVRDVLERICRVIAAEPVKVGENLIAVSVSAGGAVRTDESADALVGRADAALYRAKAGGRDRVELAG